MSDYIKKWIEIIENMSNENTYKLAWGRAILEAVSEMSDIKEKNLITFEVIAEKMLKYYWNQVFFFDLKQGPAKKPVIVRETEKCITYFVNQRNSNIPVWFDYAQSTLKQDREVYNDTMTCIVNTLKKDVSWRFKVCCGKVLDVYELNTNEKAVFLNEIDVVDLKEYAFLLSQLLNYRWSQLLEKFNNCPRIASKVNGISESKLKRSNLRKFREILVDQMKDGKIIDFYSGNVLEENDISVDHVIPWSFMYSDDIWNLVLTSKSYNSSKSNTIPSVDIIDKLNERNKDLLRRVCDDKIHQELKIAINNEYVQKFYMSCKL